MRYTGNDECPAGVKFSDYVRMRHFLEQLGVTAFIRVQLESPLNDCY